MKKKHHSGLFRDLSIIAFSVLVAIILIKTGIIASLLVASEGLGILSSFIAGFFFTSVFTTAPSIAALGEITLTHSLFLTAFFGGLGAMCGDYLIFKFVRDSFSEHILLLTQSKRVRHRIKVLFKLKSFRWFTFFIGALIIASPIPDEIGLSLMGLSKVKTKLFLPVSFVFNFIGILLLGMGVRAFLQ